MGPDLTPLTQRTFLLLSRNGPACFVSTVAHPRENVVFCMGSGYAVMGEVLLREVADVNVKQHWVGS